MIKSERGSAVQRAGADPIAPAEVLSVLPMAGRLRGKGKANNLMAVFFIPRSEKTALSFISSPPVNWEAEHKAGAASPQKQASAFLLEEAEKPWFALAPLSISKDCFSCLNELFKMQLVILHFTGIARSRCLWGQWVPWCCSAPCVGFLAGLGSPSGFLNSFGTWTGVWTDPHANRHG